MEVRYCYYMATKKKQEDTEKGCMRHGKAEGNFECTEQRLCDQRKQKIDKVLLTEAEIQSIRQVAENQSPTNDKVPYSIIEPQILQPTKSDNTLEEPTEKL